MITTEQHGSMEFREQLTELSDKMKALVKKAEDSKRDFSDTEDELFKSYRVNYENLERRLEQQERVEKGLHVYENDAEAEADDAAFMARKTGQKQTSKLFDDKGRMTRTLRNNETIARTLGVHSSAGSEEQVSFGDFMRVIATGEPKNLAEKRVMSEGVDSAGGYSVPTRLAAEVLDNASSISRLITAGASRIILDSDNLRYAKLATDAAGGWRAENAAVTIDDAVLGAVDFAPKSWALIVKASRELADDSPNFSSMITQMAARTTAAELDRVGLAGSGSGAEPTGLRNMTSVNEIVMGANGLALSGYSQIISAVQSVRDANFEPGDSMIMAPRTAAELATLVDGDSNPLRVPTDIPQRRLHTTNCSVSETQGTASDASSLFLGDWSQLVFGIRNGMRIETNTQLYQENLQIGFCIWLRADVQAFREDAFSRIIGIVPA